MRAGSSRAAQTRRRRAQAPAAQRHPDPRHARSSMQQAVGHRHSTRRRRPGRPPARSRVRGRSSGSHRARPPVSWPITSAPPPPPPRPHRAPSPSGQREQQHVSQGLGVGARRGQQPAGQHRQQIRGVHHDHLIGGTPPDCPPRPALGSTPAAAPRCGSTPANAAYNAANCPRLTTRSGSANRANNSPGPSGAASTSANPVRTPSARPNSGSNSAGAASTIPPAAGPRRAGTDPSAAARPTPMAAQPPCGVGRDVRPRPSARKTLAGTTLT